MRNRVGGCLFYCALLCCSLVEARAGILPGIQRGITAGQAVLPYRVILGSNQADRPALLFLHGAGEKGVDNVAQTRVGLGPAIESHPEAWPALIVMPQIPKDTSWTDESAGRDSPKWETLAMRALEAAIEEFGADRSRIYLTGVSMGGYGAWSLAARCPDRFAAAVPIAGGGDPASMADPLLDLPIWAFHGRLDFTVPVSQSREMVEAIREAGNDDILYTEYPFGFHAVWDRAYADRNLTSWLFAQKRSAPGADCE